MRIKQGKRPRSVLAATGFLQNLNQRPRLFHDCLKATVCILCFKHQRLVPLRHRILSAKYLQRSVPGSDYKLMSPVLCSVVPGIACTEPENIPVECQALFIVRHIYIRHCAVFTTEHPRNRRLPTMLVLHHITAPGEDHNHVFIRIEQLEQPDPIRAIRDMFINMQPRFFCQPRIAVINIVRLQHNRRRPLWKIGAGRTQLYCTACCSKAAALHSAVPDRNQFQCLLIEVPAPLQVSDAENRPYLFFKIISVLHASLPFFRFGYRPEIHIFTCKLLNK